MNRAALMLALLFCKGVLGCSEPEILLQCVSPDRVHVALYTAEWETYRFANTGADSALVGNVYVRRIADPHLLTAEVLELHPPGVLELHWSAAEILTIRYSRDARVERRQNHSDGVEILFAADEPRFAIESRCAE
jgi:hypothetical protein